MHERQTIDIKASGQKSIKTVKIFSKNKAKFGLLDGPLSMELRTPFFKNKPGRISALTILSLVLIRSGDFELQSDFQVCCGSCLEKAWRAHTKFDKGRQFGTSNCQKGTLRAHIINEVISKFCRTFFCNVQKVKRYHIRANKTYFVALLFFLFYVYKILGFIFYFIFLKFFFPALIFLYPPQRGYISFVNTFVTPRNNDLGPYVPWRHLISAKF